MPIQYLLLAMSEAIGIGYFQIENLVRNRVPMVLVLIDVNLEVIYPPAILDHLKMSTILLTTKPNDPSELTQKLSELKLPEHIPTLCLCQNGDQSKISSEKLNQLGFKNSYYARGGFQALLQEFHESKPL